MSLKIVPDAILFGQRIIAGRGTAFPVGIFFAAEGGDSGVGPRIKVGPIVGAVEHDGVIGDAQLIELIEHPPHQVVMSHHGIVIKALSLIARSLPPGYG